MTERASTHRVRLASPADQDILPPLAICVGTLTDEDYDAYLEQMAEWVDWVRATYRLNQRTIPECWPLHGAHVEELSALSTAWQAAFALAAPARSPLDWHSSFEESRRRLGEWTARAGCRPGEHRPTTESA